jgi:hypothetical protein
MPSDKARGIFISFGVGPRLPLGTFADRSDLGYGFNVELSYTNNEYLPIFFFAKAGFEQFPGSNDFYRATEYSNYSVYSFPFNGGIRYYFSPLFENIVLFMPVAEVSVSFNYYRILHEFTTESGRSNYTEEISKLGITGGLGISMFMMEILATYSYFDSNQSIGADLRIRLPLYINL